MKSILYRILGYPIALIFVVFLFNLDISLRTDYTQESIKHSSFYENGNPELEAFFVKGTAHGPVKYYHSNGKLRMKTKIDSTSLADGGIYGDSYVYNEDGALSAHIFVNKDGTIVDKMKKNNTYTSTGKKTSHNCAWCGRNFKGLGWGITSLSGTRNKNQCSAGENFVDWDETGFSAFSNFWLCSKKCAIEKCWAE